MIIDTILDNSLLAFGIIAALFIVPLFFIFNGFKDSVEAYNNIKSGDELSLEVANKASTLSKKFLIDIVIIIWGSLAFTDLFQSKFNNLKESDLILIMAFVGFIFLISLDKIFSKIYNQKESVTSSFITSVPTEIFSKYYSALFIGTIAVLLLTLLSYENSNLVFGKNILMGIFFLTHFVEGFMQKWVLNSYMA